jgi:TrmH family RNA methyltransferase
MTTALGVHSPKLDDLRALRTKAGRSKQQRYAIEGPTLVAEALASGLQPEAVFATEAAWPNLAELAARLDCPVYLTPERALAKASDLETAPGVIAVLPLAFAPLEQLFDGAPVAVLAGVADPGNAGTLVRSAEIFGFERLVFGQGGVEPHNPKVVRAAMGALFRVRLATASPGELVAAARRAGYTLVASAADGDSVDDFRFPERVAIAIGNERHGVAGWLPEWDARVAIPQAGRGESLNAAIAGSILFYAFSKQFRASARAGPAPGNA